MRWRARARQLPEIGIILDQVRDRLSLENAMGRGNNG
jgi:hypothetical protein